MAGESAMGQHDRRCPVGVAVFGVISPPRVPRNSSTLILWLLGTGLNYSAFGFEGSGSESVTAVLALPLISKLQPAITGTKCHGVTESGAHNTGNIYQRRSMKTSRVAGSGVFLLGSAVTAS